MALPQGSLRNNEAIDGLARSLLFRVAARRTAWCHARVLRKLGREFSLSDENFAEIYADFCEFSEHFVLRAQQEQEEHRRGVFDHFTQPWPSIVCIFLCCDFICYCCFTVVMGAIVTFFFTDPDLIMCRKQPGIAIGRLCDKCMYTCLTP